MKQFNFLYFKIFYVRILLRNKLINQKWIKSNLHTIAMYGKMKRLNKKEKKVKRLNLGIIKR